MKFEILQNWQLDSKKNVYVRKHVLKMSNQRNLKKKRKTN